MLVLTLVLPAANTLRSGHIGERVDEESLHLTDLCRREIASFGFLFEQGAELVQFVLGDVLLNVLVHRMVFNEIR